ncbi:DUF1272 domain-containing protein [Fictibacillus iocasae]|uniref:DUF1272 domain-containing protein n=1 Tax=Fictibacillus iocasae TaxID=2715437 RepID=A0ABW2NT82_9BACL
MRESCEKCAVKLHKTSLSFICVHECTFCEDCTVKSHHICPNCNGELVPRPKPGNVNVSCSIV